MTGRGWEIDMKIQIDKAVVEQALDALVFVANLYTDRNDPILEKPITALRSALESAENVEQEPVAVIEQLWAIIDDIDTYGDMAKSDDKLFRALVERRQKDRWKTGITTDGYTLTIPNHPAPAVLCVSQNAESETQDGLSITDETHPATDLPFDENFPFGPEVFIEDKPAVPEVSSDTGYKEADGCPTELAVLQRFWREVKSAPAVPEVEQLRDELASALEDLDREVKIGNDLMAENAKYREALDMARDVMSPDPERYNIEEALRKIEEVLK
jgi:hypothetical protein